MKKILILLILLLAAAACSKAQNEAKDSGRSGGRDHKDGQKVSLPDYDEYMSHKAVSLPSPDSVGREAKEGGDYNKPSDKANGTQPHLAGAEGERNRPYQSKGESTQGYSSRNAGETSSGREDAQLIKDSSGGGYSYRNRFLSFGMTIPADWHAVAGRELHWLLRGYDRVRFSEQMTTKKGIFYLLSISRYQPTEPGPRGEFNVNIIVHATDLSPYPGIKTGKDYLEVLRVNAKSMGANAGSDPYPVQLAGVEFWRCDWTQRVGQDFLYGATIAAVRKGYGLGFALTADSRADMAKLEDILRSVNLE